jgi:hypothetical protein
VHYVFLFVIVASLVVPPALSWYRRLAAYALKRFPEPFSR